MAVANGEPLPWEDVDELVEGVLGNALVTLALKVREGGSDSIPRAVQLAAMIAVGAAATSDDEGSAEGGDS